MNSRTKKFFSYYKPYLGLFISVMLCGFLVAIITLLLPLCARYITKNILGRMHRMRSIKSSRWAH